MCVCVCVCLCVCVCVRKREREMSTSSCGDSLKNTKCSLQTDVHKCKHTDRHTIAYPTVTVLPNSLHRQLGPARLLSEAMERAEEEEEEEEEQEEEQGPLRLKQGAG